MGEQVAIDRQTHAVVLWRAGEGVCLDWSAEEMFLRFAGRPGAFFLDSAQPQTGRSELDALGRYCFLGADPVLRVVGGGRRARLWPGPRARRFPGLLAGLARRRSAPPWALLRFLWSALRLEGECLGPPLPFAGGLVGAFSYELGRLFERLPATVTDDLGWPELNLGLYDAVWCYDRLGGEWFVAVVVPEGEAAEAALVREKTEVLGRPPLGEVDFTARAAAPVHFTRRSYAKMVQRALEYIAAGDIFQVNLSQRFEGCWAGSAPGLYLELRKRNPAPFGAYLDLAWGGRSPRHVLSSSPERFLRLQGRRVQARPIKGTRPRGQTAAEDETLARELWRSEKDTAELTMIVDLLRNDLGRVCEYGSVKVAAAKVLESYARVHHLVGVVTGQLRAGCDWLDLLRATFPGGSVTGAPKIRAMEIIDELEPVVRGVYTGALGYVDLSGDLDWNIAIRTLLLSGRRAIFQAGGGIVADSDPEGEYEETLHKAEAILQVFS